MVNKWWFGGDLHSSWQVAMENRHVERQIYCKWTLNGNVLECMEWSENPRTKGSVINFLWMSIGTLWDYYIDWLWTLSSKVYHQKLGQVFRILGTRFETGWNLWNWNILFPTFGKMGLSTVLKQATLDDGLLVTFDIHGSIALKLVKARNSRSENQNWLVLATNPLRHPCHIFCAAVLIICAHVRPIKIKAP